MLSCLFNPFAHWIPRLLHSLSSFLISFPSYYSNNKFNKNNKSDTQQSRQQTQQQKWNNMP